MVFACRRTETCLRFQAPVLVIEVKKLYQFLKAAAANHLFLRNANKIGLILPSQKVGRPCFELRSET